MDYSDASQPGAALHRFRLATTALGLIVAAGPSAALASGAPALEVQELSTKGVPDAGPYLLALNRRGPMLATCFGSREAMEASQPFEAFVEVGKDGLPKLVNLQAVRDGSDPTMDACLLSQLNKARFPEAGKRIELKIILGPALPPEEAPAD